jgi:hypothetical protein
MTKGEKYQLKLGSSFVLSEKLGLFDFANQTIRFSPAELIIYLFSSLYQWTSNVFVMSKTLCYVAYNALKLFYEL